MSVDFDNENIKFNPTTIQINDGSVLKIFGSVQGYSKTPIIDFKGNGKLVSVDLRKFGGDAANEFAEAIAPKLGMQRLEDEWVDKHYSDMLRKNKLMGV